MKQPVMAATLAGWILPRWGEYRLEEMEKLIPIRVEQWLASLKRSRGTKAKIRNIMSAVCTYAMRCGWMEKNPIHLVRQSTKRERIPVPLTPEELQKLFAELELRERVLVLLAFSGGLRRGELLALQWLDIDFRANTVNVRKSIWQQHVGPVKTEESEKLMPLDPEIVAELKRWRQETPYAQDDDWIFASERMRGRQPLWPESLIRCHIRPAAERAGIRKRFSWHAFRHSFSTLLVANGEDVKTTQSLMRHANPGITMGIYTHAISSRKREAQSKVVEMVRPRDQAAVVLTAGGTA